MSNTSPMTTHERTGAQTVIHRRTFAAPAAAVQAAHVDPTVFTQWMGPRGSQIQLDRFDAVTGGAFDYTVMVGEGRYRFRGSYHTVEPGSIVHTWEYVDEEGTTLESLSFQDLPDGGSLLQITSVYGSEQACTQMIESGIDGGMDEDFERLDEVLAASA